MLNKDQQEAFLGFYKSSQADEVLDEKTSLLIRLACAMSVGCTPCIANYLNMARERGIAEDELGAAQLIAMTISAGKINMQVTEVAKGR